MVGAAQYRDEEIDWVLSAVVGKKKQAYIQSNFKVKFGRSLNHNQVRYIKNKYGKDPRFNSPLVNIRPSKTAASPESSVLESNDLDEEEEADSPTVAGPSTQQIGEATNTHHTPGLGTPTKRKRSVKDEGEDFDRMLQHTAKTQRLNPRTHPAMTPQWNTMVAPSVTSHPHMFSPPGVTPAETVYMGTYEAAHQSSSKSTNCTPEASMGGYAWDFSGLTSLETPSSNPAALMRNVTSSPAAFNYCAVDQTSESYTFPSPQQLPQYHHTSVPPPQFTPPMPHLACFPYPQGHPQQEQQEQQGYTQGFDNNNNNNNNNKNNNQTTPNPNTIPTSTPHTSPHHTPAEAPPDPGFAEVPIEDASWDNTPQSTSSASGAAAADWARITYNPYEPSPFATVPPPMAFPFQNVRYTGLTATSAQAINKALHEQAEAEGQTGDNTPTQHPGHVTPDNTIINTVVDGLGMINMASQPASTVAPPAPHIYHPPTTMPSYPQAHGPHDHETESSSVFMGTIDPRLLTERYPSPPPGRVSFNISPLSDLQEPSE